MTIQNRPPLILWFRRDLRIHDNMAVTAALKTGQPIIPVFIRDASVEDLGACPSWRLDRSLSAFSGLLRGVGNQLVLRSGDAETCLADLCKETGATAIYYARDYTKAAIDRDTRVKKLFKANGLDVQSFPGLVLFEPWTVAKADGSPYRVYSPFWRAVKDREVEPPLPLPERIPAPERPPRSEDLSDWHLGAKMNRGATVVGRFVDVGEAAALSRLDAFVQTAVDGYRSHRDRLDLEATSGLSGALAWGEISPRVIWHAGLRAMAVGARGAEHFLKELVWREFAYHLLFHTPEIADRNWRPEWDAFPWKGESDAAERWRRGMTGEPVVDAAMREMYVTGRMHNRARMVVASYLTKHLLTDWRIGRDWFAECLEDWDPASNAMGWQWVAGSGPDAAPYFRIFNPQTQGETHDPDGIYRARYLPARDGLCSEEAELFFEAVPRSWGLTKSTPYPAPLVDLKVGRERALSAYKSFNLKEPA